MVWQKGYKLQSRSYVIEKVLGEGGFGITYQAKHTLLNQLVVIKTPNERLQNHPEYPKFVKRFIEEGRKLAKLAEQQHPNIVRVSDLFQERNLYCLIMDFVDGESLLNLVERRGALPPAEAVGYIQQIGEALIVVHQAGLVHRDAHPGNIMVQQNGKAVLIDFGIAGEIQGPNTSMHPANIAFAPYEQMRGYKKPTVDIYTLAASLYYTVTGRYPESSFDRKLHNIPLTSPRQYVSISDDLKRAILKGMELEAQNRPQSMSKWLELLPDIKSIDSGDDVIPQPNNEEEKKEYKTYNTDPLPKPDPAPKPRKNVKIPWLSLAYITFYYSILGFLSGPIAIASSYAIASAIASASSYAIASAVASAIASGYAITSGYAIANAITIAISIASAINNDLDRAFDSAGASAFASIYCLLVTRLLGLKYGWSGIAFGVVIWILCILFIFAYVHAKKKLEQKSIGEWKQFFIVAGTSLLGVFLGWLGYQFFPQLHPNIWLFR